MDALEVTEAQDNFERLHKAINNTANDLYVVAKLLYAAKENRYYKVLGYSSLAEYAAQTEIGLSGSTTSMLITLYKKFCLVDDEILDVQNIFKDYAKAYKALPLLTSNKPHDLVDIVNNNSTADIIQRVRELEGKEIDVIPTVTTYIICDKCGNKIEAANAYYSTS